MNKGLHALVLAFVLSSHVVRSQTTISQTLKISAWGPESVNANNLTKQTIEIGYGIFLGAYSETSRTFFPNCEVTCHATRRGTSINFNSIISNEKSRDAQLIAMEKSMVLMHSSFMKAAQVTGMPEDWVPSRSTFSMLDPVMFDNGAVVNLTEFVPGPHTGVIKQRVRFSTLEVVDYWKKIRTAYEEGYASAAGLCRYETNNLCAGGTKDGVYVTSIATTEGPSPPLPPSPPGSPAMTQSGGNVYFRTELKGAYTVSLNGVPDLDRLRIAIQDAGAALGLGTLSISPQETQPATFEEGEGALFYLASAPRGVLCSIWPPFVLVTVAMIAVM